MKWALSIEPWLIENAGVIEDARFKRKEALADLANAVGKKS
jgi:hypothetical protein